ncbi:protein cereblon [Drosophila grimshawi]|uniref:Protein cereblon n=1 Tax=Drosophila grimshawi TaxID=7222 RepID=CRBN_DROGR|nr:protein cereblon [Drosophila grimshawi]B4JSL2.1 RecName: Full=Protein cereblon; AltName: Full=Protein ohgata [Drosophila grimshawi]EDV94752.1 GH22576 [Drosophila grimshawi]
MDGEEAADIDETNSSNPHAAAVVATEMQAVAEAERPEEQQQQQMPQTSSGEADGDVDGDGVSAIAALATRVRLENMLEVVDNMFDEVSELMVDVTELMQRASELTGTTTPTPTAPENQAENAPEIEPAQPATPPEIAELLEEAIAANPLGHNVLNPGDDARSISSRHSGSDMSLDSPGSEDDSDAEAVPRWIIPENRVRSAVDMLVSQARNQDGGIATLLRRENFLQRVRSMVFSQDRVRGRESDEANLDAGNVVDEELSPELSPAPLDIDMEEGVRFDTNLPAEHSYFGPNLNRVPGVDYLEVGSTHRMLIFMHQHILFPGEVLPFMIDGSIIDEEIHDTGRDGVIFGVGFPLMQPPDDNPHKLYGVTCQIYEKGESGRQMVFYKSRALQRIVINCDDIQGPPQYIARNPTMKCYSKVKVLPEYFLPEPLKCIDMGSLNRFRDLPSMQDKFRRYQLTSTPWPLEACEEYSFEHIVEMARKKLEVHKIDTMPKCPIQLSYWLVRNLHLTEKMMRLTFLTDSVNTRLQIIGSTLKQESLFYCRYCNSSLAYCSDLFAMSKHGVQTQYCNSAGYIHETNTVYRIIAHAVGYSGEPSTEFSWFPGYQWHIIICKFCAQHVGWEFKAVDPNLAPKVFFGLAGSSVRIGKTSERTPTQGNPFVVRNLLHLVFREIE